MDITQDLDLASSMLGSLTPDARRRVLELHARPSRRTWDAAYSIILHGPSMLTLWQAVLAVDPSFPRTGKCTDTRGRILQDWPAVPSSAVIRRAVRYATH